MPSLMALAQATASKAPREGGRERGREGGRVRIWEECNREREGGREGMREKTRDGFTREGRRMKGEREGEGGAYRQRPGSGQSWT